MENSILYIGYEDFKMQVKLDQLEVLIKQDPKVLDTAIRTAVGEAEGYLEKRYDVATVFGRRGEQRDFPLLTFVIDMAIYHLHTHLAPGRIPDLRGIRYEAAIAWLKDVRDGKNSAALPLVPDTANIAPSAKFGHWVNTNWRI